MPGSIRSTTIASYSPVRALLRLDLAVAAHVDGMTCFAQHAFHERGRVSVVLDYNDPHMVPNYSGLISMVLRAEASPQFLLPALHARDNVFLAGRRALRRRPGISLGDFTALLLTSRMTSPGEIASLAKTPLGSTVMTIRPRARGDQVELRRFHGGQRRSVPPCTLRVGVGRAFGRGMSRRLGSSSVDASAFVALAHGDLDDLLLAVADDAPNWFFEPAMRLPTRLRKFAAVFHVLVVDGDDDVRALDAAGLRPGRSAVTLRTSAPSSAS